MWKVELPDAMLRQRWRRPFGIALQGVGPNHQKLLPQRAVAASVAEKAGRESVKFYPRRRVNADHSMTGRKRVDGIESGVEPLPVLSPGKTCLLL